MSASSGVASGRSRWGWLCRLWALSTGRFGIIVVMCVVATAIVIAAVVSALQSKRPG